MDVKILFYGVDDEDDTQFSLMMADRQAKQSENENIKINCHI